MKKESEKLKFRAWNVPDALVRPKFDQLLSKSQSWYNLLQVFGYSAGDALPCSLVMPLISPAQAAADSVIKQTTKWVAEITTKVSDAKQQEMIDIQERKEQIAKTAQEALEFAASAKAQREADQKVADEKEKARLERKHQLQIKAQEEAAEKAKASAEAVEVRIAIFKEAIAAAKKKQQDGEDIPADEVQMLIGFMNDPILGPYIPEENRSTLADIINANSASQLSASQSSTFPAATPVVKSSKGGSKQIVDLTYSDDEHDGVDIVLKSQLRQIPWRAHGLSTALVTPTLYAIQHITPEDQMLLTNNSNAHEILILGIEALKAREAVRTESSAASSDGSKRSYSMGPGARTPKSKSKKKKRMEIDSEAFTTSVRSSSASTKAKGKRRATPQYTDSEANEAAGSDADQE